MGQDWKAAETSQGWLGFRETGLVAKHFVEHSGSAKKSTIVRELVGGLSWETRARGHRGVGGPVGGMACYTFGNSTVQSGTSLCSQWFLGFVVFLLPWVSVWLRSLLKPIHVFFGAIILFLSIASVISGINEKLFFSL